MKRHMPCWAGSGGQINEVYDRREEIIPRYAGQARLKVIDVLKLLPMTNCKACGYAT